MLFVIFIIVFASASSFIPSLAKSLTDNRRRGLKRIKASGWATIVCYIITIGLTYFQFQNNEDENKRKELKADSTQIARDVKQRRAYDSSLAQMKNKFDTSNVKIVNAFGEALGRYGLKLDSANNRLVKVVRDSSKTKVVLPNSPVLSLCGGQEISLKDSNSSYKTYNINICSYGESSTNFDVSGKILVIDSINRKRSVIDLELFMKSLKVPQNQVVTKGFTIDNWVKNTEFYIYITGSYSGLGGAGKYFIDNLYIYNRKKKETLLLNKEAYSEIMSLFHRPERKL